MHRPAYGQTSSNFEKLERKYVNLVEGLFDLRTIRELLEKNFSQKEIDDLKKSLYVKE